MEKRLHAVHSTELVRAGWLCFPSVRLGSCRRRFYTAKTQIRHDPKAQLALLT